jgi:hypothetical protein
MEMTQQITLFITMVASIIIAARGVYISHKKKRPCQETYPLVPFGIFVWADAPVIAAFWFVAAAIGIITQNWYLFLLEVSIFWVVRGTGETLYWMNQQFSTIERIAPKKLPFHTYFPGDSIWFMYQITCQVVTVFAIVATVMIVKHM